MDVFFAIYFGNLENNNYLCGRLYDYYNHKHNYHNHKHSVQTKNQTIKY